MHIRLAIGIFIVFYIIQMLLCFKVKNKHVKMIPLYFCFALAFLALMLYAGVFGAPSMGMLGNGHVFVALVLLIAILIMLTALFLAMITYIVLGLVRKRESE
ncbi:MAG: hypothetical protein IJ435_05495 [Clostridia bacterium]|nr:hypothetical protein [Clostridia bacterium]